MLNVCLCGKCHPRGSTHADVVAPSGRCLRLQFGAALIADRIATPALVAAIIVFTEYLILLGQKLLQRGQEPSLLGVGVCVDAALGT